MNSGRDLLPPGLARLAVDLSPFGVNEWAIPGDRAAEVCGILADRGWAILGVDCWHKTATGFELWPDPWAMRSLQPHESWDSYVSASLVEAGQSIPLRMESMKPLDPFIVVVAVAAGDYPGGASGA